ncbi:tRNA-specific adenosine deaminase subunit tad3 [Coemansia biformis]|uniref:tRNA-specific adenosine deaminase subunit tad3 n=1 Tax=Coemansia biformis TaxID=1286918 RepID=A0A9W7YAA0_9FUNG|nr:tRNA-specific adenosine deaminase subunit tad3 [Coemansia biformis]
MADHTRCGDYLVERVPIEEERQKLETEDVYTARITAQQTSRILQFASKSFPKLDGIEHVKRVRREAHESGDTLLVILCQCKMLDRDQLSARIRDTEWAALDIAVSKVPATPPYTKDQFDRWKAVWPVAYRPLVKLKQALFSADEKEYVHQCLRLAEELCKQCDMAGGRSVAAVIGNPQARRVVAQAIDATTVSGNPLRHAVMCCIAQVADYEVAREARMTQSQTPKLDATGPESNAAAPLKRAHSPCGAAEIDDRSGYLCEGMDVFSSREPCVMCTMALVHSRIGRLFFLDSNSGGGISQYSMHSHRQLNHHFACFKCTRAEDRASES